MSFGFTVAGDRDQAAAQLEAIRDDESKDSLRNAIAALLAEHVGASELHGYQVEGTGWRSVYIIRVNGHSGPQSALSLSVTVETPYIPVIEDTPEHAVLVVAGHQAEVLAAIADFESKLGFTAPELWPDRLDQLRSRVRGVFEDTGAALATDED